MDNKVVKKLLQNMNSEEFWRIFRDYNIHGVKIPGFNYIKKADDIPKSLLINALFNQKKGKNINIAIYIYDKYLAEYNYDKYVNCINADEILEDVTVQNYNQLLIWLLVNPNECFQSKGAEYINSDKFTELLSSNTYENKIEVSIADKSVVKTLQKNEQRDHINILEDKNSELMLQITTLENKNDNLQKSLEKKKNLCANAKQKLKHFEIEINRLKAENEKLQEEIIKYDEKLQNIKQKYEEINNLYVLEKKLNEEILNNKIEEYIDIVITDDHFKVENIDTKVIIHSQNDIEKIIKKWDEINAIFVSECYISETNRRILLKEKKRQEKKIEFLSENEIQKIIFGGN